MEKILDEIAIVDGKPYYALLADLVNKIRPGRFRKNSAAIKRVQELTAMLKENPAWRTGLRKMLDTLVAETDTLSLYSEAGILPTDGFFSESFRKVAHTILPPAADAGELRYIVSSLFHKKDDFEWLQNIPGTVIAELLDTLYPREDTMKNPAALLHVINAIEVLTHRFSGIGLDPVIITRHTDLKSNNSPFFKNHHALILLVNDFHKNPEFILSRERFDAICLLIDESEKVIKKIRNDQHTRGASLSLTYSLQRMYEHTQRTRLLLEIIYELQSDVRWNSLIYFFKSIVQAENRKNSLREHFTKNIGLLAYQVTEHAGRTGEHYITHNRKSYNKMLYSAMGGGLIVGFLSVFKTGIYYLRLAPFWEAFLYSMNYSLGFIAIHLTHSTLATKQPAMTAAKIAASLDVNGTVGDSIKNLSELIVKIFRSQFIAFVGNMFIAFPVAFIVGVIFLAISGSPVAGEEKAWKMIQEIHPWRSLSLFHAAIAGVCLFVAGLISGYYDNEVVFRKIPERLNNHPLLKILLPEFLRTRFCNYIENNLGSLTGNFFLGIFLGSIGTIGFILGLPIDIRHVTFASGNFGLAFATLGLQIPLKTILITLIGIVAIGFVNFIVSFSLAIWIAVQSRGVAFNKTPILVSYLLRHLLTRPQDYLFSPREIAESEKENTTQDEEKNMD